MCSYDKYVLAKSTFYPLLFARLRLFFLFLYFEKRKWRTAPLPPSSIYYICFVFILFFSLQCTNLKRDKLYIFVWLFEIFIYFHLLNLLILSFISSWKQKRDYLDLNPCYEERR